MTYSLHIRLLPAECWWGGAINSVNPMPYREGAAEDLSDCRGNSAMPLLISNWGRYVWSEEPFKFAISDQKLAVTSIYETGELERGDGHGTLREVYRTVSKAHFSPSGKMPAPLFFTHPQYNTWIEMTYYSTQERVLDYADGILKHGFPPGALMIDTLWHPTYGTWVFDAGRYPDPQAMIRQLHDMGFKVMLWVVPYVTADTLTFRHIRAKGYLFKSPNGEPAILRWWDGYSATLDVTNPEAVAWLHEQLDRLVHEVGVDGFKFDGGQANLYRSIGVPRPHEAMNAWNRVGLRYEFSEYKDSWKSAGWPLAQRIRDRCHAWELHREGLGSLIPMGLAQGLIGYTFNCPDMIGGGEHSDFPADGKWNIDQELFVRYAQASALFPMMQFSAAVWRILNRENVGYCLEAAKLHERMGPEILSLAQESARTGEPIMRHLAYAYPDGGYEWVNDQFLLGDDILVAPVLQKGAARRPIIFPPGTWLGDDGSRVEGPVEVEVPAPLARLPWYRRERD